MSIKSEVKKLLGIETRRRKKKKKTSRRKKNGQFRRRS